MKTRLLCDVLVVHALVLGALCTVAAQDTLDVPPLDAGNKPNLVKFIRGDTTASGQRVSAHRVYRLQRGAVYVMDAQLQAGYNLRIIAPDDTPAAPTRPPMIVRGKDATGKNIKDPFQFTANRLTITFKNVLFQGLDLDRKSLEWTGPSLAKADSCRITYDKCIFNSWQWTLYSTGKGNSFFIRDCELRNNEYTWHQFVGQGLAPFQGVYVDSFVVTNTTSFNNNSYFAFLAINQIVNYLELDHNTIYMNIVDAFHFPHLVNGRVTNNLVYGDQSFGQTQAEIDAAWFDSDRERKSIVSIDTVDPGLLSGVGLSESMRRLDVSNNAYFWPAKIRNFWTANATVDTVGWMNARTRAMFDDNTAYPHLLDQDNIEADPGFVDTLMNTWVVDQVTTYCQRVRANQVPSSRNYDAHMPGGEMFLLPWPLPENLSYTHPALRIAAQGGFPVGDLNWFPAQRALWGTWVTSAEPGPSSLLPKTVGLGQNYPNPFNPETHISYSIPSSAHVHVAVYNTLGQLVRTLVDQHRDAGRHATMWDGRGENGMAQSTGVYLYRIRVGNDVFSRKMLYLK
jgi:hypothetical protein